MAGSVKVRDASALLSEVYRNVRMAEDSIINLMPKVTEERLKNELTVQISVYSAKWGILMNTLKDSTQEHLAQMLIEGTTMGVGELLRVIRDAQNNGISGEPLQLAEDVLAYEEKVVEDMKGYLR